MIQPFKIPVKTIHGDAEVTGTQLPAMRSARLLLKLGKVLGPGLAGLAAGLDDVKALPPAVSALFEQLTPDEFEAVALEVLEPTQIKVKGQASPISREVLDEFFTGHVADLFKLVGLALKANYSDFFGGALGDLSKLGEKMLASRKPSTA
jgi:hypothetical protein